MTLERGDVVFAADPFKDGDTRRPFVVISRKEMPFHGEQHLALSLTTRTWHDERLPVSNEMWIDGGAPKSSSILPWSVISIKTEWIAYRQGTLHEDVVDQAVAQLQEYIE